MVLSILVMGSTQGAAQTGSGISIYTTGGNLVCDLYPTGEVVCPPCAASSSSSRADTSTILDLNTDTVGDLCAYLARQNGVGQCRLSGEDVIDPKTRINQLILNTGVGSKLQLVNTSRLTAVIETLSTILTRCGTQEEWRKKQSEFNVPTAKIDLDVNEDGLFDITIDGKKYGGFTLRGNAKLRIYLDSQIAFVPTQENRTSTDWTKYILVPEQDTATLFPHFQFFMEHKRNAEIFTRLQQIIQREIQQLTPQGSKIPPQAELLQTATDALQQVIKYADYEHLSMDSIDIGSNTAHILLNISTPQGILTYQAKCSFSASNRRSKLQIIDLEVSSAALSFKCKGLESSQCPYPWIRFAVPDFPSSEFPHFNTTKEFLDFLKYESHNHRLKEIGIALHEYDSISY